MDTVVVNGKWTMRHEEHQLWHTEEVIRKANAMQTTLATAADVRHSIPLRGSAWKCV